MTAIGIAGYVVGSQRRCSRMKIFISWSGERSRNLAEALRRWLPRIVQSAEPWLSTASITPGVRWASDVASALEGSQFGIICLTPENMVAPWILFEAGAISKSIEQARLVPYLLGFATRELQGPLSQFQAIEADKSGTHQLVTAINSAAGPRTISPDVIAESFEIWWPRFEPQLQEIIRASTLEPVRPARTADDMLGEVLDLLRTQSLTNSSVPSSNAPLANHVRSARKHAGLTRAQLADLTGLSEIEIAQIESARQPPFVVQESAISAIARALDWGFRELRNPDDGTTFSGEDS
jgi:DNA-binding XRE family transcriptional regulator